MTAPIETICSGPAARCATRLAEQQRLASSCRSCGSCRREPGQSGREPGQSDGEIPTFEQMMDEIKALFVKHAHMKERISVLEQILTSAHETALNGSMEKMEGFDLSALSKSSLLHA